MRTSHIYILKIHRPSQILKIPRTPQIQKYSEHHFKNTQKTPQIIKIIRLLSIGMYTKNSENTENTEKKIVCQNHNIVHLVKVNILYAHCGAQTLTSLLRVCRLTTQPLRSFCLINNKDIIICVCLLCV
uniref:Uncharacterized protein n=1 Tax=Cacopsylla melanoneura TaxID=428564 RepID=A0A8D8Y945_9HEMI